MAADRDRVDLSGRWRYEPLARTEFRQHGELVAETGNLPDGGTMPVPSNWHDHGLEDFHGRVRFSRQLPSLPGDGWWLCFEGVDYLAEVALDGDTLTRHEGAFDGFSVRIPDGAERLEVTVDAPREELGTLWPYRKRQLKGIFTQWEPLEPFQATTGGIWGEVWAERRPPTHIRDLTVSTSLVPRPRIEDGAYVRSDEQDARILLEVTVHAEEAAPAELGASLCGVDGARRVDLPAGTSRHRLSLTVPEPDLWWPGDLGEPTLHELRVRIGEDVVRRRVGIREVSFDERSGTFAVNGRPLTVRGSNVIPEKWLARYDEDRARADVELVREANLNAVRVCVHVAHRTFYEACDEAGVLVWQDLPLQWDYLVDDGLVAEAADQAEAIVRRLHDHPGIALWSCHNEPFPADRAHFRDALVRAVRTVDGSRPVHAASDFSEHAYPGWFEGHVRDYRRPEDAPFVTEFGAVGLPSVDELEDLGANTWPPEGPAWDAVLHEPTPLLDVAGVELGDSVEDLVEASQRYQATVVQEGVEAYRKRGTTFFHFLLMDGWPTVSWAVVSYDRVPKRAYEALRRACQPILVGADLTRDAVSDLWDAYRFPPLAGGVWVVNDTDVALPDARWTARLGGVEIGSGAIAVAPRSLSRWTPPGERWPSWDPPDLEPGEHHLELELTDAGGDVRSRNAYPFRVVARDLDLQRPGSRT